MDSPLSQVNNPELFWPNVGSLAHYPKSTADILQRIQQFTPVRKDAIRWLCSTYGVVPEFARKLLNVLSAVGVLRASQSGYALAPVGEEYLRTGESTILFRAFSERVTGFWEMITTLKEKGPLSLTELEGQWRVAMRPLQFADNQAPIRYNWLRGFGYASLVAHQIFLTEDGLKLATDVELVRAATEEVRSEVSHLDLEEKIRVIGEFFEFEAKKRASLNDAIPSYAVKLREGDRQLDCLWIRYIPFAGHIRFPVEIQLGGKLADTLDRLETVSQWVQKAILVTTEDQEKQIIDRLKVKRSLLLDKLSIILVADVYKAVEAASVLSALAKKIFAELSSSSVPYGVLV